MGNIGPGIIATIAGIIGLAIVAVIVSKNAQTPQVFQAGGNALAQVIGAAVAPVANTTNAFGGAVGGATGGLF
jgi:hypothetical protein